MSAYFPNKENNSKSAKMVIHIKWVEIETNIKISYASPFIYWDINR